MQPRLRSYTPEAFLYIKTVLRSGMAQYFFSFFLSACYDIMSAREPTCLHDWRTAKCFPDVHLTTSAIKGVNLYDTEKEIRKNLP